jgi:glycosyltransferase involved in cell wall biosynthesis
MALLAPPPPAPVTPAAAPPTISVVVAAHNAARTLAAALDSALGQEPRPTEVIVVDDGSTDDTPAVGAAYADRVRVLRQSQAGEAAAKNAGARAASGEVVAFLDADDVLLPGWIAAVGQALRERTDLDLVLTDAWLSANGQRIDRCYGRSYRFVVDRQREALLRRNYVLGLCAVRRRRLLAAGGFDEQVAVASDWSAWIRLALTGGRLGLVDQPLAEYRTRADSLSANVVGLLRGRVDVLTRSFGYPGLDARDRAVLADSLGREQRQLQLAEAREALAAAAKDARRRTLRIAFGRKFPATTRAKAIAAAVLPRSWTRRYVAAGRDLTAGGFRDGRGAAQGGG